MADTGTDGLREQIARRLAEFRSTRLPGPRLKPASVAVCVVIEAGTTCLLMTRRTRTLRSHSGQWALPGGRREGHESIEGAALRELAEETGLVLPDSAVLGLLDDYVTRSGYAISPVVVWGGELYEALTPSESEVAELHVIPVADLDVAPRLVRIPESAAPVIQLPLLDRLLHAPTAAIVYQFCQVGLHGLHTSVAHFEQPVFAWR